MKKFLFIAVSFIVSISNAQSLIEKIDTSNYYSYYAEPSKDIPSLGGNWLRLSDVVPIIKEEVEKAGFEWIYEYKLYTLNSGEKIVLAVYCRKSNFGFVYEEGHIAMPFPGVEMRQKSISRMQGAKYNFCGYNADSKLDCIVIEKLPDNIFLLKEDCYWFQYSGNEKIDNKYLVTKEIAIKILRQDIRNCLTKVKK